MNDYILDENGQPILLEDESGFILAESSTPLDLSIGRLVVELEPNVS